MGGMTISQYNVVVPFSWKYASNVTGSIYIYMYIHMSYIHTYTYTYTCACVCVCVCARVCVCVCVWVCVCVCYNQDREMRKSYSCRTLLQTPERAEVTMQRGPHAAIVGSALTRDVYIPNPASLNRHHNLEHVHNLEQLQVRALNSLGSKLRLHTAQMVRP